MGSFSIKPLGLFVLFCLLAVIALIVILPEVDLLDAAFQRNTSPLAIRASSSSAPFASARVAVFGTAAILSAAHMRDLKLTPVQALLGQPVEVLNQSLRC